MRIQLESTDKVVAVNGVPARVWQGETAGGIPVVALITRIAPDIPDPRPEQVAEFERDLQETRAPRGELASSFPLRIVL